MKALILTADGVEDSEFHYPYYRLQEAGIETVVATPGGEKVVGKHGYSIASDADLSAVKADEYDLLVLPGGKGPETVRLNENACKVAAKMLSDGKPVGAICHGVQTLISAGVLQGRRATCWAGVRDDLKAAGADYADKEVVVDKNLVTSRQPDDLPAFMRELLKLSA